MLSKYILWSLNLLKLLHKSSNRMNTIDMLNQPSKLHSGVNVLLVPPVCIHLDPLSTIYLAQSIHDMFGRVPLLQITIVSDVVYKIMFIQCTFSLFLVDLFYTFQRVFDSNVHIHFFVIAKICKSAF